jgi:hypothetical protein
MIVLVFFKGTTLSRHAEGAKRTKLVGFIQDLLRLLHQQRAIAGITTCLLCAAPNAFASVSSGRQVDDHRSPDDVPPLYLRHQI